MNMPAHRSVSREEALDFLSTAARNWRRLPPLTEDDIGDVATALLRFVVEHTAAPQADTVTLGYEGAHTRQEAVPLQGPRRLAEGTTATSACAQTACLPGGLPADITREPQAHEGSSSVLPSDLSDGVRSNATTPPAPAPNVRSFQDRVADAHHALFHDDPTDVAERVARFFEEAAETCQALGMTHYDAEKLLSYTFSRPVGDPAHEIGSAKLTLASLSVVAGYDMDACGEAELEKLQRPETIARIRAKRATRHGRGPLPGLDPALAAMECPICDGTGKEGRHSICRDCDESPTSQQLPTSLGPVLRQPYVRPKPERPSRRLVEGARHSEGEPQ